MTAPSSRPESEDGARSSPGARAKVEIVAGTISVWALASLGFIVFAVGFWHGKEMSSLETAGPEQGPQPMSSLSVPTTGSSPQVATTLPASNAGQVAATVTIRMVKFALETVEVRAGDEVEWVNKDLTPHTVTSEAGTPHELDSGSINANASWRHRFTTAGTFPYACTFHPEMKGKVVVK